MKQVTFFELSVLFLGSVFVLGTVLSMIGIEVVQALRSIDSKLPAPTSQVQR